MTGCFVVGDALCFQHLLEQYPSSEISSTGRRTDGSGCFVDKYAHTLVETKYPTYNVTCTYVVPMLNVVGRSLN
jgi:hypothetical protein